MIFQFAKTIGIVGVSAIWMLAGCASASRQNDQQLVSLDQSLDPLRDRFDTGFGRRRFVGIFAPS